MCARWLALSAFVPSQQLGITSTRCTWLPRGQNVVFDRQFLQRDDLASSIHTLVEATTASPPLMSVPEARAYMGWPPEPAGPAVGSPVDTAPVEGTSG